MIFQNLTFLIAFYPQVAHMLDRMTGFTYLHFGGGIMGDGVIIKVGTLVCRSAFKGNKP